MKRPQLTLNADRRLFLLVSSIFILVVGAYFSYFKINRQAQAGWWNNQWQYRKSISIASTGSPLTNYQVMIADTNTSSLISSGKMTSDCNDIRITNNQGAELPFWIQEDTCNTTTTDIWVKLDELPASGGTTIYMYYGNPSAKNKSDGETTFDWFYDFSGSYISADKVDYGGGGTFTQADYLSITNDADGWDTYLYSDANFNRTQVFQARIKADTNTRTMIGWHDDTTGTSYTNLVHAIYFIGTTGGFQIYEDGSLKSSPASTFTPGNWYDIKVALLSTGAVYYYKDISSSSWTTLYTSSYSSEAALRPGMVHFDVTEFSHTENWFVRQYSSTEPTVTVNSEEETAVPDFYFSFDEGYGTTVHNQRERNGEKGLVTWYKMDETSGTTVTDTQALNSTTTTGTVTVTDGVKGKARSFPGGTTTDYVLSNPFNNFPTTAITTSFWVKTTDSGEGVISYATTGNNNEWLILNSNNLAIYRGAAAVSTGVDVNDGAWHHVAVTWDDSTNALKVYKDGVLGYSGSLAAAAITTGGGLALGQESDTVGGGFDAAQAFGGLLDNVKIYNRVLDEGEINAEYTSRHGYMVSMDPANDWVEGARISNNQRPMGKALDFDGSSGYVDIGDYSTVPPISFSAWVKPTTLTTGNIYTIAHRRTNSGGDFDWYLRFRENGGSYKTEIAYHGSVGGWSSVYGTETILPNQWYHIAFTLDASRNLKVYLNNQIQNNQTLNTYGSPVDNHNFVIGSTDSGSNPFGGVIDEVKFYKSVLSADQIKLEYNRGATQVMGIGDHSGRGAPPIGWWKLDEEGGFTAADSSGNNNPGILTNMDSADWVNGKIGKALDFDGTNDYVSIANSTDFDVNQLTISAWVYSDNFAQNMFIFEKGPVNTQYSCFFAATGLFYFRTYNNSAVVDNLSMNTLDYFHNSQWNHVACTYDGSYKRIYVNGVEAASQAYSQTLRNGQTGQRIGSHGSDGYYFNGKIDQVKIYDYARSPGQIHYDMATGSPMAYYSFDENTSTTANNSQEKLPTDGLISWWKLDEGTGTSTVIDTMGRNNLSMTNVSADDWIQTRSGNGLDLDGVTSGEGTPRNEYMVCSDATCGGTSNLDYPGSGGWSVSAWVRFDDTTRIQCAVSKAYYTLSSDNGGYNLCVSNGGTSQKPVWYATNDNNAMAVGATSLTNGVWYHLVGVYDPDASDGLENKIYVDGVLDGEANNDAGIKNSTQEFHLGVNKLSTESPAGGTDRPLNGGLDEVKVYRRALTPAEVAAEFHATRGHLINMDPTSDWVDGAQPHVQQHPLGKALDFDGTDDHLVVPPDSKLDITGTLTLEAWVKPSTLSQANNPEIISKYSSAYFYRMRFLDGGTMRFNTFGTSDTTLDSTGALIANRWNHVVMVYDGATKKIYLNGKLDSQEASTGTMAYLADARLFIGGFPSSENFSGTIDEIKIYDYPLTADDVKTAYNRGGAQVLGVGKNANDDATNLVGWWKLDDGSGFTAFDSSGKNNNGILTNMATDDWVAGKVGKALDFDGTNDNVNIPDNSLLDIGSGSWSISAWIKTTGTTRQIVVNKGTGGGQYSYSLESGSDGYADFYLYNTVNGSFMNASGRSIVNNGAWHHLTGTYDGTTIKIYVDSVLEASSTTKTGTQVTNSTSPLEIGARNGTSIPMTGQIDNVKIYASALSQAQVAWEYNQGAPLYHWDFDEGDGYIAHNRQGQAVSNAGLVGFWTLDGTSMYDSSGYGNNLTVTGSPTLVNGVKGKALDFVDGSSYGVCTDANCGAELDYQGNGNGFTVSAWSYSDAASFVTEYQLVDKYIWDTSGWNLWWAGSSHGWGFNVNNGSANYVFDGSTSMPTDRWQHIAGVYDGSYIRIYVDGVLKNSVAHTGGITNSTADFRIARYWEGKVDHVKVWQRALSAEEIAAEYHNNEKMAGLINMTTPTDWVDGAQPNLNRPKLGKALDFDGTDDYLELPFDNGLMPSGDFSVSTWAYLDSTHADSYPKIIDGDNDNYAYQLYYDTDGGGYTFSTGSGSAPYDVNSNITEKNRWYHIVGVHSGSSNLIYINGKLANSIGSVPATSYSAITTLRIGNRGTAARHWKGKIDEVKVYNYALSADQVKNDYNNNAAVRF